MLHSIFKKNTMTWTCCFTMNTCMHMLCSLQVVQQSFPFFTSSTLLTCISSNSIPSEMTRAVNRLLLHARIASHLGPVNLRLANFHTRFSTVHNVIQLVLDKWNPSNPQNGMFSLRVWRWQAIDNCISMPLLLANLTILNLGISWIK